MGRYGVDLAAFERITLPALGAAADARVVVVDELGKMELASVRFCDAVGEILGRDVHVVATVHAFRHPFTDALKRTAMSWTGLPARAEDGQRGISGSVTNPSLGITLVIVEGTVDGDRLSPTLLAN